MKIALISSLYAPHAVGGAERVAQDVAEVLVSAGHAVSVITLSAEDQPSSSEHNGVRIHHCRLKNLYWPFPVSHAADGKKILWHLIDTYNPSMGHSVGRKLDEIRPDIVHTHTIAGFSVAAWHAIKSRRLPLVHTLHDQYLLCPYSTMFKDGRNCVTRCAGCRACSAPRGYIAQRVDGVVGVSRFILERHLEFGFFAGARSAVVYSGYRAPAGVEMSRDVQVRRPLVIGYLGRIHPTKGLDRLIDAFLALPRGAAELRIGGTGDPAYVAALQKRAGAREDVRWLGQVTPESYLPGLHMLVVPSLWQEAMGRVVLEAFAYGIPVAGANRGGIPELIGPDRGWIFDPDRTGELEKLLRDCADRPGQLAGMRSAARAASSRFSHDAMLAGYLEAYRDAMQRSAAAPGPA